MLLYISVYVLADISYIFVFLLFFFFKKKTAYVMLISDWSSDVCSSDLLCSNLIGPGKVCSITLPLFGPLDFGAGNLFFPISYIFGDVLTEVYGYARARRAIWAGFAAMIFATAMSDRKSTRLNSSH